MIPVSVLVKKVRPEGKIPQYQTDGAAGVDLHAVVPNVYGEIVLYPGEFRVVCTGIAIGLPEGYEAQIRPRSGLAAKAGISVVNTPGCIDADFTGEIGVILINHGKEKLTVKTGDRIAQMVVMPVPKVFFCEVHEELSETTRGENGMGSTGVSS